MNRSSEANTAKAVKDRKCPYCNQDFTSSSLGRHLDLYIRDKNPKAPDGVHDVEAIRKIRQNITRRQPKGSVTRRAVSVSVSGSRQSPEASESPAAMSPLPQTTSAEPQTLSEASRAFPFRTTWEATGVINDLAVPKTGGKSGDVDGDGAGRGPGPAPPQRSAHRHNLKQQLDAKQQIQDAQDTARAAELAFRELLGSLRAAKQRIDIGSMPFDFDPFSLDFPALTLQCLEPPPTLFASTQHPTPTSWSILPPGPVQLEALHTYFQIEFRQWKIACAGATTAVVEELTYPPPLHAGRTDIKAEVLKAEKAAEKMEKHVYDHLEATYSIWNGLAPLQREHLWQLELARAVGRKQKEVDKLKEGQHLLRQEVAHLRTQMEQLTRLQQPREFKIAPPSTVYIDEKLVKHALEEGVSGSARQLVGLNIADRHSDLSTLTSAVIDRWKKVIVSTRSAAQRPLDTDVRGESNSQSPTATAAVQRAQETRQPRRSLSSRPTPSQAHSSRNSSLRKSFTAPTAAATTPLTALATMVPIISCAISLAGTDAADEEDDEDMSDQDVESDSESDADGDSDADANADVDMDGGTGGHFGGRFHDYPR